MKNFGKSWHSITAWIRALKPVWISMSAVERAFGPLLAMDNNNGLPLAGITSPSKTTLMCRQMGRRPTAGCPAMPTRLPQARNVGPTSEDFLGQPHRQDEHVSICHHQYWSGHVRRSAPSCLRLDEAVHFRGSSFRVQQ